MNRELLRDSIEVLQKIRAELHSGVEDGVLSQLDRVIHDLEAMHKGNPEKVASALEILLLLATLLEKVPQLARTVEHLKRLIN